MRSPDTIIIGSNHPLDTGGEFPRALERRGIQRGIGFEIVDLSKGDFPEPTKVGGLILLGGPVKNTRQQTNFYKAVIEAGTPGIAMCVSLQGMAEALEGKVDPAPEAELGFARVSLDGTHTPFRPKLTEAGETDPILGPILLANPQGVVYEFHNARVKPSEKDLVIARGEFDVVQALRAKKEDGTPGEMLGVQFHPEVRKKKDVKKFIAIYKDVFDIDKAMRSFLMRQYEEYQHLNIGPQIVERTLDEMVGVQESVAA